MRLQEILEKVHNKTKWLGNRRAGHFNVDVDLFAQGDVTTFDAFDTLMTRCVFQPSDVFVMAGCVLSREGLFSSDPEQWRRLRIGAETVARQATKAEDVSLAMIYQQAVQLGFLLPENLERALAIEKQTELRLIRPIWEVVEALRAMPALKVVGILSDTYLTGADLGELAKRCGIPVDQITITASSDSGRTKRYGSLFDHVRKENGWPNGLHLHVGDSSFSDGVQARKSGCRTVLYTGGAPSRFEIVLSRSKVTPAILASALAGSARTARLRSQATTASGKTIAEVSSGVSAIMLTAYVAWILARAQTLKLERLYFLARDGQIMLEIASRLVASYKLDLEVRYLYASRQSLHLPAVCDLDDEDIQSLDFKPGQSMRDILAKLDLTDDGPAIQALNAAGFAAEDGPLSAADIDRLIEALRSDVLMDRVRVSARRHHAQLMDYLRQERVLASGGIGIVDLGWNGRLQRSLCAAVKTIDPTFPDRLHGFYFRLLKRPLASGRLESYVGDGGAAALVPYIRAPLFEAICAARHGTTRGYATSPAGLVSPLLAPYTPGQDPADVWGVPIQQAAIMDFVDDLLDVCTVAGENLIALEPEITRAAAGVLRAFICRPTGKQAEAMGSFPHSTSQLHSAVEELAPKFRQLSWTDASLSTDWLEGSIVRSVPSPLAAAALALLEPLRRSRFYPSNARR